jgi:hypothetical protein
MTEIAKTVHHLPSGSIGHFLRHRCTLIIFVMLSCVTTLMRDVFLTEQANVNLQRYGAGMSLMRGRERGLNAFVGVQVFGIIINTMNLARVLVFHPQALVGWFFGGAMMLHDASGRFHR